MLITAWGGGGGSLQVMLLDVLLCPNKPGPSEAMWPGYSTVSGPPGYPLFAGDSFQAEFCWAQEGPGGLGGCNLRCPHRVGSPDIGSPTSPLPQWLGKKSEYNNSVFAKYIIFWLFCHQSFRKAVMFYYKKDFLKVQKTPPEQVNKKT